MEGGFNVTDMWTNRDGSIYYKDKWAKIDAIAVILNRLKVIMLIFYLIIVVVSFIVGVIVAKRLGNR